MRFSFTFDKQGGGIFWNRFNSIAGIDSICAENMILDKKETEEMRTYLIFASTAPFRGQFLKMRCAKSVLNILKLNLVF